MKDYNYTDLSDEELAKRRAELAAKPRHVPPCPPEFEEEFVRGGWRRVEMLYNCRTDLLLRWVEECGGEELYARRRGYRHGRTQAAVTGTKAKA